MVLQWSLHKPPQNSTRNTIHPAGRKQCRARGERGHRRRARAGEPQRGQEQPQRGRGTGQEPQGPRVPTGAHGPAGAACTGRHTGQQGQAGPAGTDEVHIRQQSRVVVQRRREGRECPGGPQQGGAPPGRSSGGGREVLRRMEPWTGETGSDRRRLKPPSRRTLSEKSQTGSRSAPPMGQCRHGRRPKLSRRDGVQERATPAPMELGRRLEPPSRW